jgi:hypothetical protein
VDGWTCAHGFALGGDALCLSRAGRMAVQTSGVADTIGMALLISEEISAIGILRGLREGIECWRQAQRRRQRTSLPSSGGSGCSNGDESFCKMFTTMMALI